MNLCQCQFPNSSHPLFSPWCPHVSSPRYIDTCLWSLHQSSSQPSSLQATEAGGGQAPCKLQELEKETTYFGSLEGALPCDTFKRWWFDSLEFKRNVSSYTCRRDGVAPGGLDHSIPPRRHVSAQVVSSFSSFSRNRKCLGTCANTVSTNFNLRIVICYYTW